MHKIGITGGIGSGKTTVCKVFQVLGVPVFNADTEAKHIMNTDVILIEAIRARFGAESYSSSGALNRAYLGNIVFNDTQALKELNALVHPATIRAFELWAQERKEHPYCLHEAAILFESGANKSCKFSILVSAPESLRIQRVRQRDGRSESEIKAIIDKQLPEEKKKAMADFVLMNDEVNAVIPQVLSLHRYFLSL